MLSSAEVTFSLDDGGIGSIIKTVLTNNKETPNPTCFSNMRNKQYMTQEDFSETFVVVT